MNKNLKSYLPSRALLFAVTSLLSAHAVSGPSKPVPFKATVTTTETLSLDASRCPAGASMPPIVGMTIGTGNSSHLGRIAFVATDCVQPNNGVFAFKDGRITVTSANGDLLYLTYFGTFGAPQMVSPTEWPVINIDSRYSKFIINGGTGKFANATGGGDLSGQVKINPTPLEPNAAPSPGQLVLEGTIAYP